METTHTWITHPGNAQAQAFLDAFPTPRAVRRALRTQGAAVVPVSLHGLRVNDEWCIGALLAEGDPSQHARSIHEALRYWARDVEIWRAADGSVTVR